MQWLGNNHAGDKGLNLENAVGSRKSAQAIDSSVCRITSHMKKELITNKVTDNCILHYLHTLRPCR